MMKIKWLAAWILIMHATPAQAALTDNGNSTVSDDVTGLMWEQKTVGNKSTAYTWQSALSYCETLSLGSYSDWRLPDIKELRSIVDYSTYTPAINTTVFPNTQSSYYWSSSTYANFTSDAWGVNFNSGNDGTYTKAGSYYVRCVR